MEWQVYDGRLRRGTPPRNDGQCRHQCLYMWLAADDELPIIWTLTLPACLLATKTCAKHTSAIPTADTSGVVKMYAVVRMAMKPPSNRILVETLTTFF